MNRSKKETAEYFLYECGLINELKKYGTPHIKEAILDLKTELMERGFYSFEQYNSMDVYDAVLEYGIRDVDSFCGSIKSSDKFRLYCVNP